MKRSILGWAIAMACLSVLPLAAQAQHRDGDRHQMWRGDIRHFEGRDSHQWRSGYWHHGDHGGRLGWWWVMGGLWYFYPQPVYPYPDPYLPSTVVIQQTVPVAPAPVPPVVTQAAPQVWYYCEASASYYPYVPTCPTGWKTVPATPPGAPQ
jgi:hypothetical protein